MATHTLVVEFDGDGPTYAAGDTVLGGRLVAVDFGGDRLAVADDLLEACQTFAEWLRREDAGFPVETRCAPEGEAKWREWFDENIRICALAQKQARAAIAKATQKAGVAHGN